MKIRFPAYLWLRALVSFTLLFCIVGLLVMKSAAAVLFIVYSSVLVSSVYIFFLGLQQFYYCSQEIDPLKIKIYRGLFCVVAALSVIIINTDFGLKQLIEYEYAEVSQSLYYEVLKSWEGINLQNVSGSPEASPTKEIWLYHFVVFTLNYIGGYHLYNSIVANVIFGLGSLILVYLIGLQFSKQTGAFFATALWLTLPLFYQGFSGGGSELSYLLTIQIAILSSILYLKESSRRTESILSMSAVLVLWTGHSMWIFLIPIYLTIVAGWFRRKEVYLSWLTIISVPLCLGGIFVIFSNLWIEVGNFSKLIALLPEYGERLMSNVPLVIFFFYSLDHDLSNSILLSALGSVSLIVFPLLLRKEFKRYWLNLDIGFVVACFYPFFAVFFLFELLTRNIGNYVSYGGIFLVIYFFLVLTILFCYSRIARKWNRSGRISIYVCIVFIIGWTIPTSSKGTFSKNSEFAREWRWLEDISQQFERNSTIIVDEEQLVWSLNDWTVYDPTLLIEFDESVKRNLIMEGSRVYYIGRLNHDGEKFISSDPRAKDIMKTYRAKVVAERSFFSFGLTRVYKLDFPLRNEE